MKNIFKKLLCVVLGVFLILTAVACGSGQGGENSAPSDYTRPADVNIDDSFTPTGNTLIAYFSKTNTTKGVADKIQELTGADIFEIERKEPYPDAYTPTTEVAQDEKNANARPELATYLPDSAMAQYDTIILGFPIWWHTAPMPVLSFLNYYDVNGKTIYTFCTAASSGISESTVDIRSNAKGATVVEGKRFSGGTDSSIETWLDALDLTITPIAPPSSDGDDIPPADDSTDDVDKNILIAYFSWSGTTTAMANHIKEVLPSADMFRIERETPYSTDYNTVAYGEAKDEADNNARPPVKNLPSADEMSEYGTIILCYPIWWHTAPMTVGTFLESYDLSGVDIYPITQSASMSVSQFNESFEFVSGCAFDATVHTGLGTKSNTAIDDYLRQNNLIA